MDIIDKEQFDNLHLEEDLKEETKPELSISEVMAQMDSPVDVQKEMAAKIKSYVYARWDSELSEKGHITEPTRKWVEVLNTLLEKIHREMFGDKHTSLNMHVVTHSDVSSRLRKITI